MERLLKLSTLDSTSDEARAATLRPNPNALLGAGSSSAGDDDEDDEEDNVEDQDEDDQDGSDIEDDLDSGRGGSRRGHNADSSSGGQKLYKAPKIAAMPYKVHNWFLSIRDFFLLRDTREIFTPICVTISLLFNPLP